MQIAISTLCFPLQPSFICLCRHICPWVYFFCVVVISKVCDTGARPAVFVVYANAFRSVCASVGVFMHVTDVGHPLTAVEKVTRPYRRPRSKRIFSETPKRNLAELVTRNHLRCRCNAFSFTNCGKNASPTAERLFQHHNG